MKWQEKKQLAETTQVEMNCKWVMSQITHSTHWLGMYNPLLRLNKTAQFDTNFVLGRNELKKWTVLEKTSFDFLWTVTLHKMKVIWRKCRENDAVIWLEKYKLSKERLFGYPAQTINYILDSFSIEFRCLATMSHWEMSENLSQQDKTRKWFSLPTVNPFLQTWKLKQMLPKDDNKVLCKHW